MQYRDELVQYILSELTYVRPAISLALDHIRVLEDEDSIQSALLFETVPSVLVADTSPVGIIIVATPEVAERWRSHLTKKVEQYNTARNRVEAAEYALEVNYFSRLPGIRNLFDIIVISEDQLANPDNVLEEVRCSDLLSLAEVISTAIDTSLYR